MSRDQMLIPFVATLVSRLIMANTILAQDRVSFRRADIGVESQPVWVVTADFNGDKKPDLAVASSNSDKVSILLGNGDGAFQHAYDYKVGRGPTAIAVDDFNTDNMADLAVTNGSAHTVSILLGNGDGSFQRAKDFPVGIRPTSITTGDFNEDGKPDLVVGNSGGVIPAGSTVSILLGNGDGTFQDAKDIEVGRRPSSVAVKDLNGDGHVDLVVAVTRTPYYGPEPESLPPVGTILVLLGNGDGTFQPPRTYLLGRVPKGIAIADFNGDRIPDLAVVNEWTHNVSILLGNGDGTFQEARHYAGGDRSTSIGVGDFNGDELPDLVITNGGNTHGTTISVLLGNGDGSFQRAQRFEVGRFPTSVAVADFDGDGLPDLAVTNTFSDTVSILINTTPF